DIYESLDYIKNAFRTMVELIPDENGTLVGCADDPVVMELLHSFKSKNYFTYGIHSGDYQIQSSKPKNGYTPYSVSLRGTEILQGETSLFGAHNLKNALSCIALSHQLGWDMDLVKEALRRFQGVKRRQEIIGEPGGKVVIETIASIQNYYKGRKVFSVFEPRSATSRKQIFQNEYVEAFLKADETILARPYNKNSTSVNDLFSSDFVTSELSKRGLAAQTLNNADSIVSYLCKTARPGDVILIMSNGSFGNICQKLLKSLEGI
ncbi:MAG: Mur ligase family protein, partial [Nitrospinota bacterium]